MRGLLVLLLACVVGCGSLETSLHKKHTTQAFVQNCGTTGQPATKPTILLPVMHSFMPENDLWMEDSLDLVDSNASQALFNQIIDIGSGLYADTAKKWNETLSFSRLWSDPTVNASSWRDGRGSTDVTMYGGMMRRSEVSPLGFALVMCHELSHLYGGTPFIDSAMRMSAEGQADWSGAGWCLYNVALKLKDTTPFQTTVFMDKSCKSDPICLQELNAANGLGTLLANLGRERTPNFETPDPLVVSRTELSYPRTAQCRLDTYLNGVLGLERPRCWYKP